MLEATLSTKKVYVLGIDYQVRGEIHWSEAVTHILQGKMTPFLVHPTKRVRSAGGDVDMSHPLIVRLNYWTKTYQAKSHDLNSKATRADILRRDGRTCCYCLEYATTVDHIKPESRCKKDREPFNGWTWGNLVAACRDCNSMKADRTPEEASMKLHWDPHLGGDQFRRIQDEVWRILNDGGGFILEAADYEGIL